MFQNYLILKSIHVVAMASWFAGLFFLGRMLVYYVDAGAKAGIEREAIQALLVKAMRRVTYIIVHPSMLLTIVLGLQLMVMLELQRQGWMHLKLFLVLLMVVFTFWMGRIQKAFIQKKPHNWTSFKLRLLNEVPALFLVAIVFSVYMRSISSSIWSVVLLLLAIVFGFSLVFVYRKIRFK